jgi:hypothetical protein
VALVVAGLGDVPFYHHSTRILFFTLFGLVSFHLRAWTDRRSTSCLKSVEMSEGHVERVKIADQSSPFWHRSVDRREGKPCKASLRGRSSLMA